MFALPDWDQLVQFCTERENGPTGCAQCGILPAELEQTSLVSHLLTGPVLLIEGQLAAGLSHGVLPFVVHHTRNSNMFSQRKMKGNLVWGMDFL